MTLSERALRYLDICEVAARWESKRTGLEIDPLLILAIIDCESACGETLTPKGPGGTGDGGHGRGLGQIDDRWHKAFCESEYWQNPVANIAASAQVFGDCYKAFSNNLRAAIASYNCGVGNVRKALRQLQDVDTFTTHQDYSRRVMARWEEFKR